MGGKIIEASQLPENEKVYLKKDFIGWRVVEPLKTEDGKINWFNLLLGGKRNLFLLIILLAIIGMLYLGINQLVGNYKEVADDPCSFCKTCIPKTIIKDNVRNIDWSSFNFNSSGGEINDR